jgi:hypothetical protein
MTALEALLARIVDYAGLYPPASLSLEETCANYEQYLHSADAWMLNRLVLPLPKLRLGDGWRISLLVDGEPGPQPPQVETFETRLAHRLSLPTYCEAPVETIQSGFAKMRMGGETIPMSQQVALFLRAAAARKLPFKATAGLHHPIRAVMHGFLNVFTAACFAWQGAEQSLLIDILDDESVRSFEFGESEMRWSGRPLSTEQIAAARRDFAHSFGSCSFEEPLADLRELGLLQ